MTAGPVIALIPGTRVTDVERHAGRLEAAGAQVKIAESPGSSDFEASLMGAVGVIGGGPFNGALLRRLRALRIIVSSGVGVDFVDLDAATDLGIVVANLPDICIDEVADHAMFLLLACYRRYPQTMALVRQGLWRRSETEPKLGTIPRLRGQTLGLVSFGNIARGVVPRARAFGLNVIAYDPYVDPDRFMQHGVERVELPDLCACSDFISIHTPLNTSTAGMISTKEFHAMKRAAFVINTSRGGVIDEPALIEALRTGRIAGAGLDVFAKEPPAADNPLLKMANVIYTPHTGGLSDGSSEDSGRESVAQMVMALEGKWPNSVQNPKVKAKLAPHEIFGLTPP